MNPNGSVVGIVTDIRACCFQVQPGRDQAPVGFMGSAVRSVEDHEVFLDCEESQWGNFRCAEHPVVR
jgi:hypothetical protein